MMIKTYRRDDAGTLWYRECWKHDKIFITHEGKVGTKGKTIRQSPRSRIQPNKPTIKQYFDQFPASARADGYEPIADEAHGWVFLQIWTDTPDLSSPFDTWILDEGEAALNELVGWLGVGECDGCDVGGTPPEKSGFTGTRVNLFCRVVDVPIGVKALRKFVNQHDLAKRTIIGSRQPGEDSDYELAWSPTKKITTFEL